MSFQHRASFHLPCQFGYGLYELQIQETFVVIGPSIFKQPHVQDLLDDQNDI